MSEFINAQYERNVLGSMLIDNGIIDDVVGKISREQFSVPTNAELFDAIKDSYVRNKFVNILSLQSTSKGITTDYIASLTDVGTSGNYEFYVEQLKTLYLARTMRADLYEKMNSISPENIMNTVHELDANLMSYMNMEKTKPIAIKDMVVPFIEELQKPFPTDRSLIGYTTGLETVDEIIDGVQTKKLTIVGARPSIGKSALGLCLIANMAKLENVPTSMLSFEMPKEELMLRLISFTSGVPIHNLQHKIFSHADVQRINNAANVIYKTPLTIYDKPIENELKLYSMIRLQAKQGVKCFLVDHLGLIKHSNHSMKRFEAVHDITIHLHELAKELDVSIVLLCQLKRDAEGRKPNMSDLRESGDIEQDADVIMFIHRERAMNNETEVPAEIIVEKNRGGQTGIADLVFHPKTTKFIADLTKKQPE